MVSLTWFTISQVTAIQVENGLSVSSTRVYQRRFAVEYTSEIFTHHYQTNTHSDWYHSHKRAAERTASSPWSGDTSVDYRVLQQISWSWLFIWRHVVNSVTARIMTATLVIRDGIYLDTLDVSVWAAAAGIIAADFYAAPTDSLLPMKIRQRLPAARQRSDSRLTCCFSRWRRPYAEHDVFQFYHFR